MNSCAPEATTMNPFFAALLAAAYMGAVFVVFGAVGRAH
jgi:hypothetical protein